MASRARLDRSGANTIVALYKFVVSDTDESKVHAWREAMVARRVDGTLDPMVDRVLAALTKQQP
jgi:hypothetical protein